jgi:hypothetical protein
MARRPFVSKTLLLGPELLVLFGSAVAEPLAAAQDFKDVLLTMSREGQASVRLTTVDFAKLKRLQVKATDHEQNVATFEGVLLRDAFATRRGLRSRILSALRTASTSTTRVWRINTVTNLAPHFESSLAAAAVPASGGRRVCQSVADS